MNPIERKREEEAIKLALAEIGGQELSFEQKKELAWLKMLWFERAARELPKKYYVDMSGRQHVVLDRQARKWGFPVDQATIDLYEVIKTFHDFVADNHLVLQQARDKSETHSAKKLVETKMLETKIKLADLEYQERAGKLVDRQAVKNAFAWLSQQFKEMSEQVGRAHGPGPQEKINHFLDRMLRELADGVLSV